MLHFIYNPNAGNNNAARKANILKKLYAVPNSKVWETTKPLEATYFTKKAIEENASRIIAVGGDGTVNEVASVLTETTIPLGIIPIGSGNGLARHLNIPIQFEAALDRAINGHEIGIDVGLLNNKMFFWYFPFFLVAHGRYQCDPLGSITLDPSPLGDVYFLGY